MIVAQSEPFPFVFPFLVRSRGSHNIDPRIAFLYPQSGVPRIRWVNRRRSSVPLCAEPFFRLACFFPLSFRKPWLLIFSSLSVPRGKISVAAISSRVPIAREAAGIASGSFSRFSPGGAKTLQRTSPLTPGSGLSPISCPWSFEARPDAVIRIFSSVPQKGLSKCSVFSLLFPFRLFPPGPSQGKRR